MAAIPEGPVRLRCMINRSYVKVNAPSTLFVAIDLQSPPGFQGKTRNELNVALAIDCSGSMQEDSKFEAAQEAAASLAKSLQASDRISIVSFESKASVEAPLTSARNLAVIENAIANLPLGQETDLYEGLRLAWQQISANAGQPSVVSRIIVLTDGEPTRGKIKQNDFVRLAEEIGRSGVSITAIGVGAKYNEKLLMAISQATGSLWYHASNPAYLTDLFAQQVDQMARTIVQMPVLALTLHEGTKILDAYSMRPIVSRLSLPDTQPPFNFRLKDLIAGQDQTLFIRVQVPGRGVGQYPLLRVQLGSQESELVINSTDDEQLANTETDAYPRLLWVAGDGLTHAQTWLDGETKARTNVETRLRTLLSDVNLPAAIRTNPSLEKAVTQLKQVHNEATLVAPGNMSEDDKKRLKQQTTILKTSS